MLKYNLKGIFVLAAFLLFAQAAILNHAIEHPFHQDESNCQIFLFSQSVSDETLPNNIQQFLLPSYRSISTIPIDKFVYSIKKRYFSIRSPPVLQASWT